MKSKSSSATRSESATPPADEPMIDLCRDIVAGWVGPHVAGDVLKWRMAQAYIDLFEQLESQGRKLAREQARKRHYTDALQRIADVPSGEFLVGVRRREGAEFMRELARDALGDSIRAEEHLRAEQPPAAERTQ